MLATLSLGSCRGPWYDDVSAQTPITVKRWSLVRWDDGIYPGDALYYYGGKCCFAMVLLLCDGAIMALWSDDWRDLSRGLIESLLGSMFGRL